MTPDLQEHSLESQKLPNGRRNTVTDTWIKSTGFARGSSHPCIGDELRLPWPLCWLFSQLDNGPQACDPGPQSEFSLLGSTKHLRSQLAQCRQRYQDLQEKLLISEATVFAQANQLEKYRVMLSKSLKFSITKVSVFSLGRCMLCRLHFSPPTSKQI